MVPYHKPRWPNYCSSFVRNNNVIPRALPMPGLNLSRNTDITIQIERERAQYTPYDKSPPPIHATSFLSCFNQTKPLSFWIQMHVFVYFFSCKIRISLDCFTPSIILLRDPHCLPCTLLSVSSLSCLSARVYFPVQYKYAVQRIHTQSWPLSPHRTLKFMCQIFLDYPSFLP